jgi:hypothetical protein
LISSPTWFLVELNSSWTLLGSDLVYPGLDSYLLGLKVLIPPWTQTPFQFRFVSSIFFLSSRGQLTRVTFTSSAYPNLAQTAYPNFTRALPDHINAYPALYVHTRPYTFIPGQIILLDSSPGRTSTYLALHGLTRPNYLIRSFSNLTFAYPIIPGHLIRLSYPAG